jgi:hypothetical protein
LGTTADEGTSKRETALVVRSDDSLPPPPVEPIALIQGEPLDSVCGVPLETGERVVVLYLPDHKIAKWMYIVVGVLLIPILFGLVLIAYGVMYERWHLRFVAITDRRLIVQTGEKAARWLYLKDVVELRAKRMRSAAPGVVTPETRESKTALATNAAKADATFWAEAEAIIAQGKKGALSIDKSVPPTTLGPALANALYTDGWIARMPTAHYPR